MSGEQDCFYFRLNLEATQRMYLTIIGEVDLTAEVLGFQEMHKPDE